MAATITVRALDENWDPRRGGGQARFLSDIDAVAQILKQRILFLRGEWWAQLSAGTPVFQSILGRASTTQAVALILRQVILSTPYVAGISALQVVYRPDGRNYVFAASVTTQFGAVALANQPF